MDATQTIESIRSLIAQGELETALQQLVSFCDSDLRCGELGQAARVNQADFYQLKARSVKGTISPEEFRIATNQLNDNVLAILSRFEKGEFVTPEDPKPPNKPAAKQRPAWQLYLAGSIGTLAIVFFTIRIAKQDRSKSAYSCPRYSAGYTTKVMILPFRKSGTNTGYEPEFEIMDGVNRLFNQTPGFRNAALADVNEKYPIETNYPSPADAMNIADRCGVQMIVWGRISERSGQDYKIDVFYRLSDKPRQILTSGDTTISRLVTVNGQGSFSQDAATVSGLLYMVLANQFKVEIPATLLAQLAPKPTLPDSAAQLQLAKYYLQNQEFDMALRILNTLLDENPLHVEARQTRAVLYAQRGDYEAAARDLEVAANQKPDTAVVNPQLSKALTQAYIKSNQPEKAEDAIQEYRSQGGADIQWMQKITKETRDSTTAIQERLNDAKKSAARRPTNRTRLDVAQLSIKLNDTQEAKKQTSKVLQSDKNNKEALKTLAQIQLIEGDTESLRQTIQKLLKAGLTPKDVKEWMPTVAPKITQ